jgi:hypothetical protein
MTAFKKYDDEWEKRCLEILNKEFHARPVEKHPGALISMEFDAAAKRVLGPDFRKERLSQRKQKALRAELTRRLQLRYGRYVNIQSFEPKGNGVQFECNLTRCYTTDQGRLYGSPEWCTCRDVFYTSHCFERFEERAHPDFVKFATDDWKKVYGNAPTAADLLLMMVNAGDHVHAPGGGVAFYLNVWYGALVMDVHDEFCVAKTFLTPDMLSLELDWFEPQYSMEEVKKRAGDFNSLLDILGTGGESCVWPNFEYWRPKQGDD